MSSTHAILITGARGFLAPHVVRALAQGMPDARVHAFDGRLSELSDFLKTTGPLSLVIHLAARTAKGAVAAGDETERLIQANVVGVQELLGQMRVHSVSRLLFASTLDVYDQSANAIDEQSPISPRTPYAATKWLGENLAREWARSTGGALSVVRVGNLYGPGEGQYKKLIPATIQKVLRGEPATIVGNPDALRDFVYVEDAATIIAQLASRLFQGSGDGTVNLASGISITVSETVQTICEEAGTSTPPVKTNTDAPWTSTSYDVSKLSSCVSPRPQTPLRLGITREIAWFRNQLNA